MKDEENKEMVVMDKEEDDRREVAIASTRSLQPNFKPKGVTEEQLSKFQELHKRRLHVKSKSKFHKKQKGIACSTGKINGKECDTKHQDDTVSSAALLCSSFPNSKSYANDISSVQQQNVAAHSVTNKRQKLFWGLDTKERWERKANM